MSRLLNGLLIAGAVAAGLLQAPAAEAQQMTKLRLLATNIPIGQAPVFTAQVLGYFEKFGITTENVITGSNPNSMSALINGSGDIFLTAAVGALAARSQGADVKLFGTYYNQVGSNVVITKNWAEKHKITAATPYKDRLAAMKGITIGITGPGVTDQVARYMGLEAGLDPDRDMTIVGIETSAMLPAFSQNRVDGLAISAPTSPTAVRDFGGLMLFNLSRGEVPPLNGVLGSTLLARTEWLKANEAVAVKFLQGMQMGLDTMKDPALTNQARDTVRAKFFPQVEAELFAGIWKDQADGAPKTLDISADMVQTLVNFNNRVAKEKLDPSLKDSVQTNEYVMKAQAATRAQK